MTKYIVNYYKVLKIEKDADKETIEEKCEKLSKKYDEERYPKEYKIIQDAQIILTDDEKRAKYDKLLEKASKKEEEEEKEKTEFERKDKKKHGKRGYKRGRGRSRGMSKSFKQASGMGRGAGMAKGAGMARGAGMAKGSASLSKAIGSAIGASKGQPFISGLNLLMGGAVAGYGVKKGRDYIRKGRNRQ